MRKIIFICILLLAPKFYAQPVPGIMYDTEKNGESYTDTSIDGWKVKVNVHLLEDHKLITAKAESILQTELQAIEKVLPSQAMPYLKEMPIWLEFMTPDNQPIQYHNSAKWLSTHGYDPKKESALEIVVTDYASMPHDSLPILRLMCYAYQHRVLGLGNQEIQDVYKNAQDSRIYLVTAGTRKFFPFKSRLDYFASISTAYFGEVAYAPYNRKKLKEMDPRGYELVEKLWKVKE
jgi:hypothetical protein